VEKYVEDGRTKKEEERMDIYCGFYMKQKHRFGAENSENINIWYSVTHSYQ
jgi:hypothetical protein